MLSVRRRTVENYQGKVNINNIKLVCEIDWVVSSKLLQSFSLLNLQSVREFWLGPLIPEYLIVAPLLQ